MTIDTIRLWLRKFEWGWDGREKDWLSLKVPKDIVAAKLLSRHSYELLGDQDAIPHTEILDCRADNDQLRKLADSLSLP